MSAGASLLVGALSCGACVAMGLVVCGIVLDHRDRAARSMQAPGLASEVVPALVERTPARAGVLPAPSPAGAAFVAAASVITAHELAEDRIHPAASAPARGARRDAAAEMARRLADEGAEAVTLSTCNKTEIYVVHADPAVAAALASRPFEENQLPDGVYRLRDAAAAKHLFRVAAGLDSLVIGEAEILGQVRTAYVARTTAPRRSRARSTPKCSRSSASATNSGEPTWSSPRRALGGSWLTMSRWQRPSRRAEGGRCF